MTLGIPTANGRLRFDEQINLTRKEIEGLNSDEVLALIVHKYGGQEDIVSDLIGKSFEEVDETIFNRITSS